MLTSNKSTNNPAVQLSPKKLEALNKLSIPGVKLSDGYDYDLREYASATTSLDEVRNRLSSIKSSLSDEIVQERKK